MWLCTDTHSVCVYWTCITNKECTLRPPLLHNIRPSMAQKHTGCLSMPESLIVVLNKHLLVLDLKISCWYVRLWRNAPSQTYLSHELYDSRVIRWAGHASMLYQHQGYTKLFCYIVFLHTMQMEIGHTTNRWKRTRLQLWLWFQVSSPF